MGQNRTGAPIVKWKVGLVMAAFAAGLWYALIIPGEPSIIVQAEVLALEDVPDGNGLRRIQVRLPDGEEAWIVTLAPFFYKVGYTANVAIYEPLLGPPHYDVVAG